ncbi:MarR family winged helix-turn-helix transcriptional regulator [Microbacterium sp. SORGH_AS_0888]|uniref:MarR family winged helix-turn-helix transcriptional regulator n=1 Tax=Microbacterium sp. SORGH_AS_0888 TaxID=3041791 RepID=UPI0027805BB6|nr:MarR family transcriptional regulator [Microbacterium sp. SORGH_AS_0888]MDQ1130771.1 DNA-binding MarR family transcriptional regulator [Microbacterium sp. SORGH_AS_0888]
MTQPAADRPDQTRERAVRDLEEAFAELMREFRSIYAQAATTAAPGMLPGTFKTLIVIARQGPLTQSVLAERIAADKGLVSRQVTELEGLGMIARTADPTDGRVRLIEITEYGRDRVRTALDPYQSMLLGALKDWPLVSIERLTSLIHALAAGVAPHADDVFESPQRDA